MLIRPGYLLVLMESEHAQQLAHLQRLADELSSRGFSVQVKGAGRKAFAQVANPDNPKLTERILCKPAEDGSWCFWWPWHQPIGSADDLTAVAGKIMTVLRSVEDM